MNQFLGRKNNPVIQNFVRGTDRIGNVLRKSKIRPVSKPLTTIGSILECPKDKIHSESHGVYSIPCCDCQKMYFGQTNRRISATIQELNLQQQEQTPALLNTTIIKYQTIDFDDRREIAHTQHHKQRVVPRYAIEIENLQDSTSSRIVFETQEFFLVHQRHCCDDTLSEGNVLSFSEIIRQQKLRFSSIFFFFLNERTNFVTMYSIFRNGNNGFRLYFSKPLNGYQYFCCDTFC